MLCVQVPNNYETDLVFPIVKRAADIAGIDYHSASTTEQQRTSLKVRLHPRYLFFRGTAAHTKGMHVCLRPMLV
jgi:alanyl-tRNA synthetase